MLGEANARDLCNMEPTAAEFPELNKMKVAPIAKEAAVLNMCLLL